MKTFFKSELSRNVLTLMSGTTLAQVIAVISTPVLTRIYTPVEFGTFAFLMSVTAILTVIVTGRYELAVMLPSGNKKASDLVWLSIMIAFIFSCIILLIIFRFREYINSLIGSEGPSYLLFFIPVALLSGAVMRAYSYYCNRNKEYKKIAISGILNTLFSSLIKIILGILYRPLGLFAGFINGQIISVGYLVWSSQKLCRFPARKEIAKAAS
ncbi:MAG: lipopolysaccharide biosynthesis protein, partial [Candidatus Muiribacteriaceae bacterium]